MIETRDAKGKLIAVQLTQDEQRRLARDNIALLKAQQPNKVH